MTDTTLDQLGLELAGIESAAAPTPAPGAAVPAPIDYQAECSMLIGFAFDTLSPFYPATCEAWTPEKRAALIAASVPVATKYGLTLGGLFDRYGAEVGFALVVLPMIGPTMAGLRADRAAVQAAAPAGIPAPAVQAGASAPIASTVTPPPPASVKTPPVPVFAMGEGVTIGAPAA